MNICTIYVITNLINNRIYIGQTWQSLKDRWQSGHGYRESIYFNSAIKKYGSDNFEYDILALCSDQDTANYIEDYYIELYNSRNKNIGYNIKEGGSHGKHSQETKIKISIAHRGKILSEETKQKLRAINIGKIHSEESKEKMAASSKGNKSHTGRQLSKEHLKNLSTSKLGHVVSEETKRKISEANTGKKRSQTFRNNLLGNKNSLGRKLSQETKDKISKARKGIVFSEETKNKMSIAAKGKLDSEETKKKKSKAQRKRQKLLRENK